MKALTFETTVLENGIIQIPLPQSWKDTEVSVFIVKKNNKGRKIKELISKNKNAAELISEFRRIRNMESPEAQVLTMENAINIYDELTQDISGQ